MAQPTTTTKYTTLVLMAEGYPETEFVGLEYHLVRSPSQLIEYVRYVGIPDSIVVHSLKGLSAADAISVFFELTLHTKLPHHFSICPYFRLEDTDWYAVRELSSRYFDRKNKYI